MSLALGTYLDILCSFSDVTSDKDLNQLKQQNGNKSDDQKKTEKKMTQKKEKQKLFNLIICVNFESLRRNALKQTDNNKTFYDIVQRKDLIRNR